MGIYASAHQHEQLWECLSCEATYYGTEAEIRSHKWGTERISGGETVALCDICVAEYKERRQHPQVAATSMGD